MDELVVLDSDISSAFAKINKLDELNELFSKHILKITPEIYQELTVSLDYGYTFPLKIFEEFDIVSLDEKEEKEFERILTEERRNLGKGEIEAIVVCENRDGVFCSIDRSALDFAEEKGVRTLDLHMILKAFWRSEICTKKEVKKMIKDIEEKDNTKILEKNVIFS
ncbi:MAG: hypothetical protein ACLFVB_10210 [Thermoplasmata archaeon]